MKRPSLRGLVRSLLAEVRAVDDAVGPPSAAGVPFATSQLRVLRAGRTEPPGRRP